MLEGSANPISEEEEDVKNLKFPSEFSNAETLLISEVRMLLETRQKELMEVCGKEISEAFADTITYCERFSSYRNKETLLAVKDALASKGLHPFEVASLANLGPQTAEEAKVLIPSLENRISDYDLQKLLDDLLTKKSFQS